MSVNIKYKNNSIATMSDTGTKTLKTTGKYCEADIIVENTKDSGGGTQFGDYDIVQTGTTTPASNISEYVLDTGITIASKTQAENTLFLVFLDYVYDSSSNALNTLLVGIGGRNNRLIPSFSYSPAVYLTGAL